ncbi:armadillo repeat-containing protein 8 isoform X2 [Selaginella moellendorffii]|uniref:armadillo repeat-containing protein 8 isoform X2 n=1 Tax=Selaginella moellendorffii TaxID=88036 RepID=UPI000D1C2F7A|nr:armadillo repeat-containing protein 8 isoform X2 [Selaginella moellendorffii]|eukprot:XP_024538734.1 armadillo repeat-containing protein 8 isoform X2 [Selaginella moellendorffii]
MKPPPDSLPSKTKMPASAVCTKPEDLVESLSSLDTSARLKALRDVKNQIIGNKTKKLSYIKLGAVPRVVEILASDTDIPLLVQSAAAVGSFACGTDAGVKAVLDSGVLPHLLRMLSNGNNKVVEASARSLKMIFQSTLAPKNDMFQGRRIDLILALLNSGNENVSEVAASVLARCCETSEHQKALADAGCLQSLVFLLSGSPKRKEAALDALAALTRGNPDTSAALAATGAVSTIIRTMKDKSPRARLLACMCLSNIGRACHNNYQQEWDIRKSILSTVGKLIDENGQVGEEAPGVLADLVANNEELQKTAFDFNIIERLAEVLQRSCVPEKQLEGVLMALAELCSRLEDSRRKLLELQAQCSIAMALGHESEGVRIAACACIKSISRSVKNLRTTLTDERLVWPLFRLLNDPSPAVQASALSAVSNVVLDFTPHKAVFFQCGGVSQLIQLALSMEPMLRLNAVWALRNLLYLADMSVKEKVMRELTVSTLVDLVCDSEEMVQEQALAFVRNLVYGSVASVQQIFAADAAILHAVERQLCVATRPEICTQALYVLSNVAAGNEYHKDAVMDFVAPALTGDRSVSILIKFLLDMSNPQLRVAAVWCISNLSFPESPGVGTRVARLRDAGIQLQLQKMFDDPCTDVKDRVKTTMEQFLCTDQMT